MLLKALHKYIRIYLYTYISVQKPPASLAPIGHLMYKENAVGLVDDASLCSESFLFGRLLNEVPVFGTSVDEANGYHSPLGTRIPLAENTKAEQISLCPSALSAVKQNLCKSVLLVLSLLTLSLSKCRRNPCQTSQCQSVPKKSVSISVYVNPHLN